MENTNNQLLENVILELRRGVIVLAVLSQLEEEQYGYSLIKLLSDQGLVHRSGHAVPAAAPVRVPGLAIIGLAR
jgi:PadR family transcriptional regulator, regulatory protein PadR